VADGTAGALLLALTGRTTSVPSVL
jgi:hypothetical protein